MVMNYTSSSSTTPNPPHLPTGPKITVLGVGGGGGNAVNNMISSGLTGVNFVVANTDAQALENSLSDVKIRLGNVAAGGLGAGARPEIGRAAAEESLDDVMQELIDSNMVFITAGMGGGTGTGAAPVIAQACKEQGILTVGVVTKPFQFEGVQRMRMADSGIEELAAHVDTLIVIPNQNLFRVANEKTTFSEAFLLADDVLQAGVKGVADLMVVPGMINLDFADVRSATSEMGKAMMGTGKANGERRALDAAEQAINNPLLDDVSMKGARSVIINICGGHDLTLFEVEEACNRITDEVASEATIIFGATYDDSLAEGEIRITVVATGIEAESTKHVGSTDTSSFSPPRAIRPVNVNTTTTQDVPQVETAPTPTRQFEAQHPEPAPVQYGVAASSGMPESVPAVPAVTMPQQESPNMNQAVAMDSSHVQHQPSTQIEPPQQPQIEETQFVAEGATLRKVETQPYHGDHNQQETYTSTLDQAKSLIPAAAPAPSLNRNEQQAAPTVSPSPVQPTTATVEKRKAPSLFDRITGRHTAPETETKVQQPVSVTTAPATPTVTTKTVGQGQQGMLNIETPKVQQKTGGSSSADDLDIPAFLRRQIS